MPLIHAMQIGNIRLENNLALAPMAGTTETGFRRMCRMQGAGLVVTELVSARGICHDPDLRRSMRYLYIDKREKPVAIQLFGADPDDFIKAINIIAAHPITGSCDLIDLNMGCPVSKVVRQGEGCALMKNLPLAARIIAACVRVADRPVTVKFRKGWDESQVNAVEFARMCEESGASALTIHGRTRAQMYGGRADWEVIGKVKQSVGIPVYGNGDITSVQSARQMLEDTAVDGLMVGRAVQGNPWLFRQLINGLASAGTSQEVPDVSEKISLILDHLDGLIFRLGEYTAVREMRGHLVCYIKGTAHGSDLKRRASLAASKSEILDILEDWRIHCGKTCENS